MSEEHIEIGMRFETLSDGPGTLTIVPDTVVASRRVSLKIIFRSGIRLEPGACLRFHIPQAFTSPQVDSPLKPGFCRIRNDPKFRFSLSLKRTGSDKDGAYVTRWGKCVYATLESGTVRSGDEVTLLYGEKASEAEKTFGSVSGTFAPFFSGDHPVQFALDALVPEDKYKCFVKMRSFDEASIRKFADSIDRDPGIVLGRLIKDNKIPESDIYLSKKLRQPYSAVLENYGFSKN